MSVSAIWFLASIASLPTSASAAPTAVALELDGGSNPYAKAVARLVRSIAEYSRWPDETRPLSLCVAGPAYHAGQLGDFQLSRKRLMRLRKVAPTPAAVGNCDAIYLGRISFENQRLLNDSVRGKAVLTIAENDPACRSRAMFCLTFQVDALSYQMNLDAVSRSGVRVDPRVLRLAATESPVT